LYKAPRGTSDILPDEQVYWRYVEAKAIALCQLYGYRRLDTPSFEDANLFMRSIGEGTDIVTKEMYVFEDRSHNLMALRPEGTASVCRAYLEHGMNNLPQPVKLYYLATIFRYERPQSGRYRQHYQFGFEAIGEADMALDAEVIDMAWQFFRSLGIRELFLYINSIGCKNCRPEYLKNLKDYYSNCINELCKDCQARFANNTLRLLDCKQPECQKAADNAPKNTEFLCQECDNHFKSLGKYLVLLDIPYKVNHKLVRGLDYYTKTVFEIQPAQEGSQSALGGGGRYDNLIEEIGGKSTPAIGFASGMERVVTILRREKVKVADTQKPVVFIACLGDEAKFEGAKLAATLRRQGISVAGAVGGRSLKAQLKQADALSSRYTAILGDEELKNSSVTLRDMSTGEQRTVSREIVHEILNEVVKIR
jgi:histidyl-tRNA synthetase